MLRRSPAAAASGARARGAAAFASGTAASALLPEDLSSSGPCSESLQARDRPGTISRIVRVGILGHGRFGRALGSLLSDADLPYLALDPANNPPANIRANSISELVDGAEIVVVAVPVPAIGRAVEQLRPALNPHQLVIDVGSVKLGPDQAMRKALGAAIPWTATHPLFGPAS